MCNLYSMTSAQDSVRQLFEVTDPRQPNLPLLRAIFPGQDAPVVRPVEDGRELTMMHWGFVLPQQGKAPKDVTNARDDKVRESRFWRESFERRRCLVPVTSFAEPKGKRPAIWHWFGLKGDEPRPLFAFAGIWRPWRGNYRGEQVQMNTFAFLTTKPNEIVAPIHPTRMPVILAPENYEAWLSGTPEEAFGLARPFASDAMHIVFRGDKLDPGHSGSDDLFAEGPVA